MVLLTNGGQSSLSETERAFNSEFESSDPNQPSKNLERIIRKDVLARKKVVFKVAMDLECEKGEEKAIRALDMKLTVIGDMDPIQVAIKLREKVGYSEICSIGPAKEEKVDGEKAVSSWVTQGAGGRKKLLAENAPMAMDDDDDDDATFSNIGHLMQRMDISAEAGTSYSAQVMVGQDRAKDIMVERKRLLNEQEMSIKRMVELEGLLATQKALLTAERVVLEELIAKDEQLRELNKALELEKLKNAELTSSKENDYFKGVADCRSKILKRYPQLDLSWMDKL